MSDETEDNADKEHEPTQHRLEEARKRGEIARSPDVLAAAGYGGLLLASMAFGAGALQRAGEGAAVLLDQSDRLAPLMMRSGAAPFAGILQGFGVAVSPFLLLPGAAVLLVIIAQRGLIFSPSKLLPKVSRLSPLQGIKTKFGREGLFEFAKSAVKLCVISGILGLFLIARADDILATLHLTPALGLSVLLRLLVEFLALVTAVALVVGGIDFLWQRSQHLRRNRMSRKEMMDEMKDSEGDPQMKAQRRQRGYDIATNRMLADVAKADVVVVNPTHYAVALKWNRADRHAPICLAKGTDDIAARIRDRAAEAGVPIHRDPPTARALFATVALGEEIRPDHYRAVAAAIRFAEAMRKKAGRSR